MQETENNIEETTVDTTVDETTDTAPQRELTPAEQELQDLQTERLGKFKVGMSVEDAKYYRNLLDKSEYKGPQEAYLLIIAKAELSSIVNALNNHEKLTRYDVEVSSACIESLGFFMNRTTGKGADSATKLFTSSMLLRPAMNQINALDAKITEAKEKVKAEDK